MEKDDNTPYKFYLSVTNLSNIWGITPQAIIQYFGEDKQDLQKIGKAYRIYPNDMIAIREKRKLPNSKHKIFCTHVTKGGVGKTMATHGLSCFASMLGYKTLVIDLDMQADLTSSFGIKPVPNETKTILNAFTKENTIQECVVQINPFLHLIPASMSLTKFDMHLKTTNTNSQTLFKRLISPIEMDYDFIFIDCPPSLNAVTSAAQLYSDVLLMPTELEEFAVQNLEYSFDNLASLSEQYEVKCSPKIFLSKVDGRLTSFFDYFESLNASYGDLVCKNYISASTEVKKALKNKKFLWEVKAKTSVLEDISNLFFEITELNEWRNKRVQ
ncbi:MAG: ParA family protein [Oligoflexia bacterium]|nr:ParA family protein [Oligoflexia bacterium]